MYINQRSEEISYVSNYSHNNYLLIQKMLQYTIVFLGTLRRWRHSKLYVVVSCSFTSSMTGIINIDE
jgi:hypothetical protein